ncbi:MAG: hypothetical protein QM613_03765 [Micrococcaceae bacterium]
MQQRRVKQESGKGIYKQNHPKSKNGFRKLDLDPARKILRILEEYKQRQDITTPMVFPSRSNGCISVNNFNRARRNLCRKYERPDLADIVITKIRKTVNSHVEENAHNVGVIKAGSRQLGNTNDVNERHYQARVTREVHNSEFLPDFLDDDFNEFE